MNSNMMDLVYDCVAWINENPKGSFASVVVGLFAGLILATVLK